VPAAAATELRRFDPAVPTARGFAFGAATALDRRPDPIAVAVARGELERAGYRVVRVQASLVVSDLESALERIRAALLRWALVA
jgi:hypothetical protein